MPEILALPAAASGVDRRRVLHGAAWAAPAILVATAAPAFAAASTSPGIVSLASSTFVASGANSALTVVVANAVAAPGASLSGVSVEVSVPSTKVSPTLVASPATPWVLSGPTVVGGRRVYTVTLSGTIAATMQSSFTMTFAPAGEDPYPVDAILTARATTLGSPVSATRTLTGPGTANPLIGTAITSRNLTGQTYRVAFALPAGVALASPVITVTWTPSEPTDANSKVTANGWSRTYSQPAGSTTRVTTLTQTTAIAAGGTVTLDFLKPIAIAGAANDFSAVFSGIPTGSTTVRQVTVVGDYV